MSVQEIIAELTKLKPEEIILVKARVDDMANASGPQPDVGTAERGLFKIRSIKGHQVLTPDITQAELADELFTHG